MVILCCELKILSPLALEEVAQVISNQVLGGIPFVGREHRIRDEIPAVYTEGEFLGMHAVLMGEPDDEGFMLTMDTGALLTTLSSREIRESFVNISPLVAKLLSGAEQIKVIEIE